MKETFNCGTTRLSELEPGSRAVVVAIDDDGPIGRRLLDLGMAPNTPIEMLRRAPMGDPAVYELRGYRLCLRRSETTRIRVRQPAPEEQPPATG